ncbi:MAG: asparagine synthase-related protein, partial [Spirosomaceae bacterium]|nr:asparagine synthase-related protein [Spirosomataceae bacterium]
LNSFRESFEKAISIRKANEISAANLSGGLDSSSVVSVLASQLNQKLFTVYFNAQKPEADERKFAEIVAKKYHTTHQEVTAPKSLFESLISLTEKIAQPDPGVLPSFIHEAIFDEVKRTDAKRLFSGHGGDNVVSYGFEYLAGLFRERKWRKFKTEAKKYDDSRQNDESISAGIFKRNIKQFVEKKKFWKAFYLAFICICYFGIIPLPKSLFISKELKPQPIDYKHLE